MSGGYESSQADVAASTSYGPNPTLTLNPAQLFEGEQQRGTASGSPAAAYMGVGLESGLVEVADKSCSVCRNRKVKCDRILPECTRCRRRGEVCDFGEGVAVVMRRIVPAPVSSHPTPSISIASPFQNPPPSPYLNPASPRRQYPPAPAPRPKHRFSEFSIAPSSSALAKHNKYDQVSTISDNASQWDDFLRSSDIGPRSQDWKLAQPVMASSLTLSLLDASMHSCCFHLPAFHIFEDRIAHYKSNLGNLDVPSQVVVAILTSLGARASPHSALLGVEGPDVDQGGLGSRDLVLSAGRRRENAWRAITDRAVTLCSIDIMNSPTRKHLEVLLAVCNMLLFSEVVPIQARFFLRQAIGLFKDVHSIGLSPGELDSIKRSIGPALYESDARTAAYATMPFLVRESDLGEYFDGTGVQVPDLAQADLGLGLEHILSPEWGKVTREKLDSALAMTGFFVSAIQRTFATIATDRDPARLVREVQDLWRKLDRVHGAIQRLHRSLKSLPYTPAGCEHLNHALDYDLLLVVRMDARMVDIVNLTHVQLLARRERLRWTPHEGFLEELIAASEKRMRKCLRLLAFYAKIFTDSLDKHIVYHLFIQVEVIPWVGLVVQRVGEEGGPTSAEYEMSPVELDWFSDALEVACFYMPLASVRLQELQRGRDARRFSPIDSPFLPTPSPGSLQRSPGTSTSSGSPGEHSTSSSHSPPLSYFPSSHSPPHNYPATSPSGVIGNSFDFAFGNSAAGAYSPGGNQGGSLSVDYSDFGGAGMLGQSPQGQDGLPVFDDKAWQKDELTRW